MRNFRNTCLLLALACLPLGTMAQEAVPAARLVEVGEGYSQTSVNTTVFRNNSLVTSGDEQYIAYYDADGFPLLGKAAERTETRYERLPAEYRGVSRGPVWELGKCSAGLAVRFRSNSTTIAARWTALFDRTMNHQTQTGTRGLDLYCLQEDGAWTFVNSARPTGQKNETVIITDMEPAEREYMLYLPLYDGLTDLEIGIDSLARIGQPAVDLPQRERPVVFYGTSILQGGCANRPGMAHTSIISRRLNRECINLGFSGNALLDLENGNAADIAARLSSWQKKPAEFFDWIAIADPNFRQQALPPLLRLAGQRRWFADLDDDAIAAATKKLSPFQGRFNIHKSKLESFLNSDPSG